MKKKITQFRWLVMMILFVTAMAMPSVAWAWTQPEGEGTEANPYQISDDYELYWFAEHVNAGNTTACAKLTEDIYVSGEWTPIGSAPYTGTFDGQGHTISGLRFSSDTQDSGPWGFFRGTETNSVIRNVGIVNSSFNGWQEIGGVCGSNNGTIENCYFTGTVSGRQSVGGVCGSNNGTIKNCYNNGYVSCCSKSDRGMYGGVCGINFGTIENCYNTGTVSGFDEVGGVCGNNIGTIKNCYNTGTVSGNEYVGGVCNGNDGTITGCYNTGAVSSNGNSVGGVCVDNSGTLTNCYYLSGTATGGIGSYDVEGSAEVKTDTQFASGEVCYLLNGSRSEGTEENPLAWYQNISPSSRDLYPVLTGTGTNTVYQVKILCGGTDDVGKAYSNTNKDITVEHILIGPAVFNSGKKIYSKICQREGCGKTLYYADAAGTIKATPNAEETAFAVASYTLADPTPYDNQAVFTATNFTYTRTFSNTNWTTWYVPFELTLTPEICSKFAFSRINNVHQYDTDNDGNAGKTVVESFRQTAGVTLKANYPYLVKPVSESDLNMVLNLTNVQPALAEAKSIDCQSVDYKYVFTGTYDEMGESGATLYDPYTLYSDGTWQHYHSLEPMRHYLTIESRNATTSAAAFMRSILLSVVGDEDVTGIVKIYDEERRAKETYDLGGRRIPAGSQRNGFYIENGKVIYKK